MKRIFLIVLDGVGVGAAPDAAEYNDSGTNTLSHLAAHVGGLDLPVMGAMGLGNITAISGVPRTDHPTASWGKMQEISQGKDTITGHWEMAGIVSKNPFPTYPGGFPPEVISMIEQAMGRTGMWYKTASGTEILDELGEEHMRTGKPIIYTSADSVLQIAAHEDIIVPEELHDICRRVREQLLEPPHNICRVIARPFIGPPFMRTYRRRDFPLDPPGETLLDLMKAAGHEVLNVGKVIDMFSGRGFTGGRKTQGNTDGMSAINECARDMKHGLMFSNLVDFDTVYGHRKDFEGFARALNEFDTWLGVFLEQMRETDYLIITADHGLDPAHKGIDHTREYVPVLFYRKHSESEKKGPCPLGTREGFFDVGATVAEIFSLNNYTTGKSFNL